jgi:formylglycine-generating enzyme required for sulfatase activity
MSGNVWEWTNTRYDRTTLVIHGGSWDSDSEYMSTGYRSDNRSDRNYNLGFRLVQDI